MNGRFFPLAKLGWAFLAPSHLMLWLALLTAIVLIAGRARLGRWLAIVTALLVAVFAALVVGLQAALAGVTQGQTLAVAASTLIAFALFQPVRRRVQRAVDRRFDRARYDSEQTAAAFAERLRHQVDLDAVARDLTGSVERTLRPTTLGLWLKEPGR